MKPKRTWTGLALLAGLAVVTLLVWTVSQQAEEQHQVLGSGAIVTLKGVTYGREHRLPVGKVWQRIAGRLLPPELARRFGTSYLSYTSTNDMLVVWWQLSSRAGGAVPTYAMSEARIADGSGNAFVARDSWNPPGTSMLRGIPFNVAPRGTERISIQLRFNNLFSQQEDLAGFVVRNPAYRARIVRIEPGAGSIPATGRVDDVELVLTDLVPSLPRWGPPTAELSWTTVAGRLLAGGQPNLDWQMCGIEVFDPDGGVYRPGAVSGALSINPKQSQLSFAGNLSPDKVWKLRIALCRIGGFPTNELWPVRDIPLEGLARATFMPRSNVVNGVSVSLYDVSTGRPRDLRLVTIPPDAEVMVVLCDVTDEQGRKSDLRHAGLAPSPNRRDFQGFNFPLDRDLVSKTVDATFAITRLRYVELLVKPSAGFTNVASIFPAPRN